ncbi:amino acid ABC transporter substrate-binding protein (PAAT family) [Bosea psychrotolerans]|uniref:Amino acid ABC transporter substrate-binding protein (PAAT family) n=2 Tax=Bosea psychrotolerans TaxID=1871628 RepID=A0A2S4LSI5_9HYPH|nr:amino acid ABC transporter substrate-binding protein (PAAT family) [Bosea psychrotolerans]
MRPLQVVFGAAAVFAAAAAAQAGTLEKVKERGELICGTSPGVPGFSLPNAQGQWAGFDVDLCRAVAATVLNDAGKVKYIPLNPKDRFAVVQSGEVDVLSRQTTWSLSRDTTLGLSFSAITYFDGQALMVKKTLGVKSAKELNGATVCVQGGTTTELNIADFFQKNSLKYEPVSFASGDEAIKAFETGRCDAFTTDASALYAYRLKVANPQDFVVLPELISKEPLGPAVRRGDEAWANIVRWTHYAMINAEELGLSSANVDEQAKSTNPEIKRFLGVDGNLGEGLGLTKDWAYRIVKQVGNYGESYDKYLGPASPLGIPRGANNLWSKGGLQYAPPIR